MLLFNIGIAIALLAVPPHLLTRLCFSSRRNQQCAYPVITALLPFLLCLGFTYLKIPINRAYLLAAYFALLMITVLLTLLLHKSISLPQIENWQPIFLLILATFITFPYTRLTGIDTYKWQDLATAIRLESSIPWLIHPMGLLGFLPRSYPSFQPTLLASIQIMGNLGVEGGFRVLSVFVVTMAFMTSKSWFSMILPSKYQTIAAFLYVISPVFVRYTHWATGRGLFMALMPALLYIFSFRQCIPDKRQNAWTALYRYCMIVVLSMLLLLSHKAAWIALPLLLGAHLFCGAIPKSLLPKQLLLLLFVLLGILISPRIALPGFMGNALGAAWLMVSRFAWLFLAAVVGWLNRDKPLTENAPYSTAMLLFSVPLALDPQMYGALIATPFIVVFAICSIDKWISRLSFTQKGMIWGFLIGLSLMAAIMVVVARSRMAATVDIKDAARYLNHHDPYGPFLIHAPSPQRTRIQAYVTGSPRFTFSGEPKLAAAIPAPPWHARRPSRNSVGAWTAWLRNIFRFEGLHVEWYGDVQRNYHFTIEGLGDIPVNAHLLYENDTVQIYQE